MRNLLFRALANNMSMLVMLITLLVWRLPSSASNPTAECFPLAADPNSFTCVDTTEYKEVEESSACQDQNGECAKWARLGECKKNPVYMLPNCRDSCNSCLDLHVGETQAVPEVRWRQAILGKLYETRTYIYETASSHSGMFHKCRNEHPMCTYWSLTGDCVNNAGFMQLSCRAACQTCHSK